MSLKVPKGPNQAYASQDRPNMTTTTSDLKWTECKVFVAEADTFLLRELCADLEPVVANP